MLCVAFRSWAVFLSLLHNVRKHYQRERIIAVDRRNTDSSSRIEKRCPKVHSELVKNGLRN
jgi:hypothetical protein